MLCINSQPKKKKANRESEMQQAFIKWVRYQYPNQIIFAIPNGGIRSKLEAAIMQGEGVVAGMPDTMLAMPRGQWHGLFIEFKVLPNVPSSKQLVMMDRLVKAGYCCQVAYTLDQGMQHVNDYMRLAPPGLNITDDFDARSAYAPIRQ